MCAFLHVCEDIEYSAEWSCNNYIFLIQYLAWCRDKKKSNLSAIWFLFRRSKNSVRDKFSTKFPFAMFNDILTRLSERQEDYGKHCICLGHFVSLIHRIMLAHVTMDFKVF